MTSTCQRLSRLHHNGQILRVSGALSLTNVDISITPEVPEKIQDNLATLELASAPGRGRRMSGLQSPSPVQEFYPRNYPSNPPPATTHTPAPAPAPAVTPAVSQEAAYKKDNPFAPRNNSLSDPTSDQPSFSHFPPLRNRPTNVPPSDDEKESILEKARLPVLNCNDPEVQLSWAQDALTFVDISAQHEARIAPNQGARPQTPAIEHQLRVDAVNVVSFLAEQHHPKAEFLKGMWLEFGKFGLRMDKKEAFRCYQRSAQRGYTRAEYRMGMQFESSNDAEKAIKHYQLGVEGGDSASNYRMGMMALLGQHSQPQDYAKGIRMISYAAETADENAPQGAYVYGMLQARELPQVSVPEQFMKLDLLGARYNLEKAAYLGFAKAQTKMGVAFELSQLGCEFNPVLSLHYNALAAKQGEPEADMSISKWFLCGYEGIFDKNEELSYIYAQRAAQSGLSTAEFAMGYFYEVGIHVTADIRISRSWYEKAADHGNQDAKSRIEGISRSRTLSRKDHEQMAVAKIKSQYGSHEGKRPDRFRNNDNLPTISDTPGDTLDMPEPKLPPSRAGYRPGERPYPSYGQYGAPTARPKSVAPYPVDDDNMRPPPQARPYSGANPPNGRPPRGGPYLQPTSPDTDSSFGDKNYRGSAFPTFRPSNVQSQDPGRGSRTPQPPPQTSSNGPGYRPPYQTQSGLRPSPSPAIGDPRPPPSKTPVIDIGFSAPHDPEEDRRRLLRKEVPGGGAQRPPRLDTNQALSPRLASSPHPFGSPVQGRDDNHAKRPFSAGKPNPTAPASQYKPVDGASLEKPPKLQDPGRASNTPPPNQPVQAKIPGKGPKTFGEMGLPSQKQENDCVSSAVVRWLDKH